MFSSKRLTDPATKTPPPTMEAVVNESSATLTFVGREVKQKDDQTDNSQSRFTLFRNVLHPGIGDRNFVRPFTKPQDDPRRLAWVGATPSALTSMVHRAFSQHQSIRFRPDDVHLMIELGIARFLQEYPEDFRQSVVNFNGKQTIQTNLVDSGNRKEWDALPIEFARFIRTLIKDPVLADLLLQQYSGSSEKDLIVKAVILMGAFSSFFSYKTLSLCHIPQFILEGTVEDWRKLAELPKSLLTNLQLTDSNASTPNQGCNLMYRWLTRLQLILDKMYEGRQGIIDSEFWCDLYKLKERSGGDIVTGNIVYFHPFLQETGMGSGQQSICPNRFILGESVTLGTEVGREILGPTTDAFLPDLITVPLELVQVIDGQMKVFPMAITAGFPTFGTDPEEVVSAYADYEIYFTSTVPPGFKVRPQTESEKDIPRGVSDQGMFRVVDKPERGKKRPAEAAL